MNAITDYEIMAPVGSRESLAAALQAGADSVYFGIGQLNMRSHSANHFTLDDLQEIAALCMDSSIASLTEEMSRLHAAEVDAVILTHYHKRHSQYVGRLAERQIVRALVLPEPLTDDEREICKSLEDVAALYGIPTVHVSQGEAYDFHGVEITVFPRTILSRSTHPVSGVRIDLPDCAAVLASSSFNQGDPLLVEAVNRADVLILGPHSPVYKKTFRLDFEEEPEVMAFCADALAYMEEIPDGYVPIDGRPIRITGRGRG